MREQLATLLVALIGGFAGGAVLVAAAGWARRQTRRRRGHGDAYEQHRPQQGDGDRKQFELLRDDLWKIRDAVTRVLEEVADLSRRLDGVARTAPSQPSMPAGGPASGPLYSRPSQPGHDRTAQDSGWSSGPDGSPYGSRRTYDAAPPAPGRSGYESGPGQYDVPATDTALPSSPRPPAGPPPNAVNVEARDDRIVASSSYPPEAWLEPRGPAVAHLWLNPNVALNENALRRLSTFFQWQVERAGATYDTDRPAVLRWDEGQRVGTVNERGSARPR